MKRVIVLRHAKSSWEDPSLDDHDRPLNKRGKEAVPAIAEWLSRRKYVPDIVLCSSAVRTKQTVKRLRNVMPRLPDPVVESALYHAAPETMRNRLASLPRDCGTAMLVGHQPGIGSLVRKLSDGREKRRCRRAFEHFPTAAAAVLEFDTDDWSEIDYERGRFIDFAVPRELMTS